MNKLVGLILAYVQYTSLNNETNSGVAQWLGSRSLTGVSEWVSEWVELTPHRTQYRSFRRWIRPWESCTSPIQYWMTNDINNPLISHCLLFTMALKGMEPAPKPQWWRGSKKTELNADSDAMQPVLWWCSWSWRRRPMRIAVKLPLEYHASVLRCVAADLWTHTITETFAIRGKSMYMIKLWLKTRKRGILKYDKYLHKSPSKRWPRNAKASRCRREWWHHLPYVMHSLSLFAGQALLMTSQSRSRTEYLIPTDNIRVLDWCFNFTNK